jgi:hypothetical protein
MWNTTTTLASLALLLTLSQGCSSSSSGQGQGQSAQSGAPSTCTATLTGAVSGTFACKVTLAYDGSASTTDFSFSLTNTTAATDPNVTAGIAIAKPTAVGVSTSATAGVEGPVALSFEGSNDAWIATADSKNTAATGSYSIDIKALGDIHSSGASSYYTSTHGTFDAVMLPVTAGQTSGQVVVHAEF